MINELPSNPYRYSRQWRYRETGHTPSIATNKKLYTEKKWQSTFQTMSYNSYTMMPTSTIHVSLIHTVHTYVAAPLGTRNSGLQSTAWSLLLCERHDSLLDESIAKLSAPKHNISQDTPAGLLCRPSAHTWTVATRDRWRGSPRRWRTLHQALLKSLLELLIRLCAAGEDRRTLR